MNVIIYANYMACEYVCLKYNEAVKFWGKWRNGNFCGFSCLRILIFLVNDAKFVWYLADSFWYKQQSWCSDEVCCAYGVVKLRKNWMGHLIGEGNRDIQWY